MVVKTWRSGVVLFTALLLIQLGYASTKANTDTRPTGIWIKSDGTEVEMPCPSLDSYGDRALKLPAGCVVPKAGVWLSVKRFESLKAQTSELSATLNATKELLEQTRGDLLSERNEFSSYLRRTENKLNSIGDDLRSSQFSWTSAGVGLAFGASMCGGVLIGGAL